MVYLFTMEQRKLCKAGPTARHFGVKVAWLKTEADAGRVPALIAEDRYLFDLDAVEAALLERARRADSGEE